MKKTEAEEMTEIDTLIEIAKKRRSIRKFKQDPVPDEYIEQIIEAARWASSGANTQLGVCRC
jgi:nitroreductase